MTSLQVARAVFPDGDERLVAAYAVWLDDGQPRGNLEACAFRAGWEAAESAGPPVGAADERPVYTFLGAAERDLFCAAVTGYAARDGGSAADPAGVAALAVRLLAAVRDLREPTPPMPARRPARPAPQIERQGAPDVPFLGRSKT